jgi:ferric-dicitrate binding protein FerR (iron transport regulator)
MDVTSSFDDSHVVIDRYLAGECTPAETERITQWIAENPTLQGDIAALRAAAALGNAAVDPAEIARVAVACKRARMGKVPGMVFGARSLGGIAGLGGQTLQAWASRVDLTRGWVARQDVEVDFAQLMRRLGGAPDSSVSLTSARSAKPLTRPERRRSRWVTWATGTSAVLGAALVIGVIVSTLRTGRHAPSVSTYTTNRGQRANITLPDGNQVALGVASRLDVPADYEMGRHIVRLQGEALFTVTHRTSALFLVQAGHTDVRVLGTSFVVRNYATDTTTLVAVRDGKVSVQSAIVAAHQEVEVGHGGVRRVRVTDPARFSFANGVLTLDRMPFPGAFEELGRWYDADIRLGDPRLQLPPITAQLSAGSVADLTTMLTATFDVRVVRNGRVLTLFPK